MFNTMMQMAGLSRVAQPYPLTQPPQINPLDPMQLMGVLAHGQAMQLAQNDTGAASLAERAEMERIERETGVEIDPYSKSGNSQQPTMNALDSGERKTVDPERVRAYLRQRELEKQQHRPAVQMPQRQQAQPEETREDPLMIMQRLEARRRGM
jgi:hypothetical protein